MAEFVFGKNDTTHNYDLSLVAGRCYVSLFELSEAHPNITSLFLHVKTAEGSAKIKPVIYDNYYNSGSAYYTNTPNNLVAIGDETVGLSAGWNELSFSSSVSLSSGKYHLGFVSDTGLDVYGETDDTTAYSSFYTAQDGYPTAATDPYVRASANGYWYPVYAAGEVTGDLDATLPTLSFADYGAHGYEGSVGGWGVLSALELEGQSGQFLMEMDGTLPALESEGYTGASLDADLLYIECAATIVPTGIRTGDYFNDYTATLPVLEVEGSFGHHASLDATLPDLECEARTGSRASGKLPYMEATATGSISQIARLDKKLPIVSLTATMGARLDKKLPAVTLEAEMSTPVLMRLNKRLPVPDLEATISGGSGSLNKILFFPKIEATASGRNAATLDANLPTITSAAKAKSGATMSLDATLPELRIEADSYSAVINLDAYLPTVTSGVASGTGYGGTGSTMSGDRFDGTLLRHERWA